MYAFYVPSVLYNVRSSAYYKKEYNKNLFLLIYYRGETYLELKLRFSWKHKGLNYIFYILHLLTKNEKENIYFILCIYFTIILTKQKPMIV